MYKAVAAICHLNHDSSRRSNIDDCIFVARIAVSIPLLLREMTYKYNHGTERTYAIIL